LELTSTILELKEIITQKLDVEDQLAHVRDHLAKIDAQKVQLQHELETASDYILELEEKVYKANKTSLELLRQLKDAEVEIETLKNYIIELK
jgi:phage shock protein A